MSCIIPPAPGQPWRVLILDASDPADPKWVIATVATPAHVRPAGIRAQGADEITAQWVASASGLHRPAFTRLPDALVWRVDEGGQR
jgi:hypothetical protein